MEDKRISLKRKRLNLQLVPAEKKRPNLQSEMRTMIEFCYLNTRNPLSENFNNITMWLNLTCVNLQNNTLTVLPREFGKLRLLKLNLSENDFGTSNSTKWPWIEQNDIKNTLRILDISDNSLTKLPLHIERLNALRILIASKNLLTFLPQCIGNMQNLVSLNVSHNELQYLPATIIFANLHTINVEMNPFRTQEHNMFNVPSLARLSANIVLRQRLPYDTILPRIFAKYFEDDVEHCFLCGRSGIGLLPLYLLLPRNFPICYVYCPTNNTILFEIYCCLSHCEDNMRQAEHNRNINTLIDYICEQLFLLRRIYRANEDILIM